MLQPFLRLPFSKLVTPICRLLLKIGIGANAITFLGTFGTVLAAFLLIPNGHLLAGCLVITAFVLFDLLDGNMARMSAQGPSKFGALLDSTLDRVSDGSILLALTIYLHRLDSKLEIVVLLNVLLGFLISYIKARAESLGMVCDGGFAERTERLIIVLVSVGFAGIGISYVLAIGIWILFVSSLITVIQRLRIVYLGS